MTSFCGGPRPQLTFRQSTPRKGKASAASKAAAKPKPKAPKGGRNLADSNCVFAADEPWEDDFYFGGDLDISEVDLAEVVQAAPTRQARTSVGSVRSVEEMPPPPAAPPLHRAKSVAAAPGDAAPVNPKAKLQALRKYRAEVGPLETLSAPQTTNADLPSPADGRPPRCRRPRDDH